MKQLRKNKLRHKAVEIKMQLQWNGIDFFFLKIRSQYLNNCDLIFLKQNYNIAHFKYTAQTIQLIFDVVYFITGVIQSRPTSQLKFLIFLKDLKLVEITVTHQF